jgi:hypothetical protein
MGGSFERRTPTEMAAIPMRHDVTAAAVAAACSSTAVAPFLMCVDRAVVAAAAGTAPGGSLFRAIAGVAGEFVTKPKTAFAQPALWMVAGVYGGTYLAKNVSDVCIERRGLSESHKGAAAAKFAATTAFNMGGSILKDAAFARLYGSAVAAVVLVPPTSYALFAARDCLTIGGAFVVPDALAAGLANATGAAPETAATVSQLVSPPLMQVLCTPMHLLSLSLINDPGATAAVRLARLRAATPATLLARSLRMLPAYGVGGILNATLVARGRALARRRAGLGGGTGGAPAVGKEGRKRRVDEEKNKDGSSAASRSNVARETLAGGRFFGDGFFSGNTGGGLEGLAVAAGLRGAAGFGGAEEHHAPRRRGAPAAQRAPVAHARALRVPPPRFAALTLSNGDAEARARGAGGGASSSGSDDAAETPLAARFSRTKRFGERFRARLRRGGGDGCGAGGGGRQRFASWGRGGVWRPGRAAGAAAAGT